MNRKSAVFLCLSLVVATMVSAQTPDKKQPSLGERVASIQDARKQLAAALADTFARETETLQPSLGVRNSNSLQIISAGVPNPFNTNAPAASTSNNEQKALSQKALNATNFENAQSYSNFLKEQGQSYKQRLAAIKTDSIPDVFQYQLRSDIFWRMGMLKSGETINDIGGNANLIWTLDNENQRILAYPVATLRNNPRFGFVDNFNEGFARIKKNQVFGFMSIAGIEVIPCQYELAEPFNDGRALVKKFDWYFIDFDGTESEPLGDIESAQALKWGYSIAKFKQAQALPATTNTPTKKPTNTGRVALIDNNFDKSHQPISDYYDDIMPFFKSSDLFLVRSGKKYGLLRIDGKIRTDVSFDRVEIMGIAGLARVEIDRKFGIIDSTGSVKVPIIYDEIGDFNNYGAAMLKSREDIYILHLENFRVSKSYQSIRPFDAKGFAVFQDKNKRFGVINKAFQEVIAPVFVSLGDFNQFDIAPACREEGQCGYIRRDGSEAVPIRYREVDKFSAYGYAIVRQFNPNCSKSDKSERCVQDLIVDLAGRIVLKPEETFTSGYRYRLTDTLLNNFIVVKTLVTDPQAETQRLYYHLINKNTHASITSMAYESIRGYDKQYMFLVKKDNKWGLIDTTGKMTVRCIYKEITLPREGLYAVKYDNNKYGFIDAKGKLYINYEYEEVKAFKNGLAIVSKGENKMGIINMFNAKIAPCSFKAVEYLDAEQIELIDSGGTKYVLNTKGECQSNCTKFEEILRKANQEDTK
ncbi:MAG: WG repeat-containing protein [Spirosomataceae bacterium]